MAQNLQFHQVQQLVGECRHSTQYFILPGDMPNQALDTLSLRTNQAYMTLLNALAHKLGVLDAAEVDRIFIHASIAYFGTNHNVFWQYKLSLRLKLGNEEAPIDPEALHLRFFFPTKEANSF